MCTNKWCLFPEMIINNVHLVLGNSKKCVQWEVPIPLMINLGKKCCWDLRSKEPTGDPVDSDPEQSSEPTVWSRPGFATQHETLTVFTHLACSQKYNEYKFLFRSCALQKNKDRSRAFEK